jgi:hypothetical protein
VGHINERLLRRPLDRGNVRRVKAIRLGSRKRPPVSTDFPHICWFSSIEWQLK